MRPIASACVALLGAASAALAQPSVTVDFTGASISSLSTNPADLVRTSTGTIDAAAGYTFVFNPTVHGTGFIGAVLFPNPIPLGDLLNSFVVGQQRILRGAVRNPGGAVPVNLDTEVVDGTFSGQAVSLTFQQTVLAARQGQAAIRNIHKPFGLGIAVDSGGAVFTVGALAPAQKSEFHFDGDLLSVKETGLAPSSGPGKMRYLDDPAFGPILGGPGAETTYPNPPTPQDVTRQQSAFGTTANFGIPAINGEVDTVYRTSPTRNLSDPTNRAKSRGLGLALWPNTRDYWPEDRNGQWTMVWDLLIPTAAWNAEFPAALIEDNHNNDSEADAFLHKVNGQAQFGYQTALTSYLTLAAVQPNQWFRLAISSDGYRSKTGRMFVNGAFVGTTGGDWVYSSCKSTDPRWGDVSSTNPQGTAVDAGVWASWGRFPSPWAQAPNSTMAPMASTICLFADLQGRGESVYVANFLYTDEAMTDAAIAALGGPNARGIAYLRAPACVADFDDGSGTGHPDGGVTIDDLLFYLGLFNAGDVRGDIDDGSGTNHPDGGVTIDDLLYFLLRFNAGC